MSSGLDVSASPFGRCAQPTWRCGAEPSFFSSTGWPRSGGPSAPLIQRETRKCSLSVWLKAHHPQWHTVGRVTFHLAGNKRDEAGPFALLATYTHRLSDHGSPQRPPLARASQDKGGNAWSSSSRRTAGWQMAEVQNRAPRGTALSSQSGNSPSGLDDPEKRRPVRDLSFARERHRKGAARSRSKSFLLRDC